MKLISSIFILIMLTGCQFENLPEERSGQLEYLKDYASSPFKPGVILETIDDSDIKIRIDSITTLNGHPALKATRFYNNKNQHKAIKGTEVYIGLFFIKGQNSMQDYAFIHFIGGYDGQKDQPNEIYIVNETNKNSISILGFNWDNLIHDDYLSSSASPKNLATGFINLTNKMQNNHDFINSITTEITKYNIN